jgi:hypothetical protein
MAAWRGVESASRADDATAGFTMDLGGWRTSDDEKAYSSLIILSNILFDLFDI